MGVTIPLGLGTGLVYPTFLAGIADYTYPQQRAKSVGVRLWREMGYAIGAILTGMIAGIWGIVPSIWVISGLTILSAIVILVRMKDRVV